MEDQIKKAKHFVFLASSVILIVFIIFSFTALLNNPKYLIYGITHINPLLYLIAIVILILGYSLGFIKWLLLIRGYNIKLSLLNHFLLYFSMYSMELSPGRWGRAISTYLLSKKYHIKHAYLFPIIVADIFTDFSGFVVVAVFSSLFIKRYVIASITIAIILLIPLFIFTNRKLYSFVKRKLLKIKNEKARYYIFKFLKNGDLYFQGHSLLKKRKYLLSLTFTIPAELLKALSLYFIILAMGFNVNNLYIIVLFMYASSTLIGALSGIPGGIGVSDFILIGYLSTFLAIPYVYAVIINILFRALVLWLIPILGLLVLVITSRRI